MYLPDRTTPIQTELEEKLFTDQPLDLDAPEGNDELMNSQNQSGRQRDLRFKASPIAAIRSDGLHQAASILLLALILTTQTGCQLFGGFGKRIPVAPVVFRNTPTKDQLIQTLNAQSSAVRQLSTKVKVAMDGMPKLRGTLQMERPGRMRLKAGLLGVSEMGVDVGSNDQLFWVWVRASIPGERPAIYYAKHDQWQNSPIQRSLPLDPAWLIDGTGLAEFKPTEQHEGPFSDGDGRLKLITFRQTGSGRQTRVTLIDPKSAQIEQQAVYDANNRLLAYTNSTDYRVHQETGVNLPHRIEMHVYQNGGQEVKMVVEAADYSINALYGDPQKMWGMPTPGDVPAINLAEVPVE